MKFIIATSANVHIVAGDDGYATVQSSAHPSSTITSGSGLLRSLHSTLKFVFKTALLANVSETNSSNKAGV